MESLVVKNQKGIAQILIIFILILAIGLGVYLIQTKQIFSPRASSDPIVFKDTNGNPLPTNQGLPTTSDINVQIQLNVPPAP